MDASADENEYLDSDRDGVADGYDDCPEVNGNSTVDVLGCPDFDGDDGETQRWPIETTDSTQWRTQIQMVMVIIRWNKSRPLP